MKPLISVIVPIYKVEKYLTICVDSLLRQSYGNLEIILVDDGKLEEFRKNGNLIEERAYHTVYGIWTYFTADDGQRVKLTETDHSHKQKRRNK